MGRPFYAVIIPLEAGAPEHPIAPTPPGYPDQGLPVPPDYPSQGPIGPPPGIWPRPPGGGHPSHPIHRPPGIWGGGRPPVDPGYGVPGGRPDQGLPGGEYPSQGLPAGPDQGLPPIPPTAGHLPWNPGPDHGGPGSPSHPIWLPTPPGSPDQGLPVDPPGTIWPPIPPSGGAHPDQGLPGGEHPSQGLPAPQQGYLLAYIPSVGYRYIKVDLGAGTGAETKPGETPQPK